MTSLVAKSLWESAMLLLSSALNYRLLSTCSQPALSAAAQLRR
jgi:hypothetical protein